ncbi:MAG: tRNA-guanine transglycosylase, partial [Verrucomicrobiota bacterium]|nr:tRNA-guanine transglycosylase [Verrucomicrobiota bacterium]
ARSLEMTIRWARRCKAVASASTRSSAGNNRLEADSTGQLIFGIVQGATFADLRRESAEATVQIGFDGYAIGGVSVGEPETEMMLAVENSEPFLPADKPRYCMGLGTPPQMIELIARGVDMFDCVLPTRLARNGTAFTADGTLNLKNAEFTLDARPIEEGCTCPACAEFTRGYIRHLVKAEEILGLRLISLHNLHFYLELMTRTRRAIEDGSFAAFRRSFVAGYRVREASA